MVFFNTKPGFLYRQFLVSPPKAPSSTSLEGKTGIVTGANTGLGYQASRKLLSLGLSHLILAVRNLSKGEEARKSLLASLPSSIKPPPVIEVWSLDLADYTSIIAFVDRVKSSSLHIDFAILNAGVANFTHTLNPTTQHETTIQINWLSTALLTLLLVDELDRQAFNNPNRPRPVLSIVNSETAAWARFKELDISNFQKIPLLSILDNQKYFNATERYYSSKLLQQIFFAELVARRQRSSKVWLEGTVLNLVNPGFCYGTELHRSAEGVFGVVLHGMKGVVGRSISVGARTLVHAAVLAEEMSNGMFLSDCRVAPFAGSVEGRRRREEAGRVVWEEMVSELGGVVDIKGLVDVE